MAVVAQWLLWPWRVPEVPGGALSFPAFSVRLLPLFVSGFSVRSCSFSAWLSRGSNCCPHARVCHFAPERARVNTAAILGL